MKILFIGHTYHKKTKSSVFVLDLIREKHQVLEFYLDPDGPDSYKELQEIEEKNFDILIVWQVMPVINKLKKYISWKKATFFPMFDHYYIHGGLYNTDWKEYTDFTIINFSITQHKELEKNGFCSKYIQYFPKPKEITNWGKEKSIFFWQRLEFLNLSTVAKVFENNELEYVHIHKALDPGHKFKDIDSFEDDTKYHFRNTKFTSSTWFEHKEEMLEKIQDCALYMAPRYYEGIGMSFLEAMAMGRCVVSPDHATMTEYIKDGVNGFIYKWDDTNKTRCCEPINIGDYDIREIQKNAYQTIVEGYSKWEKEKYNILEWINNDATPDKKRQERCAIEHGWEDWELKDQPWPDAKALEQEMTTLEPSVPSNNTKDLQVSVITVVFNAIANGRKETLIQCMDTVQAQEGVNIEHVIIDGGSNDGTIDLVKEYENKNYPVRILSKKDTGIYEAMNRGIAVAHGEYITFLNSDDFYHNNKGLQISVECIKNNNCTFSFAPICIADRPQGFNLHELPLLYLDEVFYHAVFSHQSIIVDRKTMVKLHGFDLSYRSAADYENVLRLLLEGNKGCYVKDTFASFRMIGISSTDIQLSIHETACAMKRVYNKYLGTQLDHNGGLRVHVSHSFPRKDRKKANKKLNKILSKAFVNVPTRKREHTYVFDCLKKGKLKTLFYFYLVKLNSRFDKKWYMKTYTDVNFSEYCAAEHYLTKGWKEGKDPSPRFSTSGYLRLNDDVRESGICPLIHWKLKGKKEHRKFC